MDERSKQHATSAGVHPAFCLVSFLFHPTHGKAPDWLPRFEFIVQADPSG